MTEKNNTNKWLLGCGIGCGALILIVIAAVGIGYFFVKDIVKGFQSADESTKRIEAQFGSVEDFTPDPDGGLSPERVAVFLSVRDSIAWPRMELEHSLETLTGHIEHIDRGDKSLWGVLGIVRQGFGFVPRMAEYHEIRNDALLAQGMGLGEYDYLYVILYYSYLGKNPEDGPDFALVGEKDGANFRWQDEEEGQEETEDLLQQRRYIIVKRIHRILLPMMERQLDALGDRSGGGSPAWKNQLSAEIDALKKERDRVPWQDGLPQRFKKGLEPFRARLESSYCLMINPIELQATRISR